MKDTFEFTLNNPLTEEQWDMISDVDFDQTDLITFHTKHGKEVEFIKVIRCKDCMSWRKSCFESVNEMVCNKTRYIMKADGYCSMAKPKEKK